MQCPKTMATELSVANSISSYGKVSNNCPKNKAAVLASCHHSSGDLLGEGDATFDKINIKIRVKVE